MNLALGILDDGNGTAKIACPLHEKIFSLETGESREQKDYSIKVFDVRVPAGDVQLRLPLDGT